MRNKTEFPKCILVVQKFLLFKSSVSSLPSQNSKTENLIEIRRGVESRQGRESTPPILPTKEDTGQVTQERLVKKTYSVVRLHQKVSLWVPQTERGHMITFPPSIGTCSAETDQDMM